MTPLPRMSAIGRAPRQSAARAEMFARLGTPHILQTWPATIELRPAAELGRPTRAALGCAATAFLVLVYVAWVSGSLEGIEDEPISDYLAHLAGLAWTAWMLLPGGFLLVAALLQVQRLRRPAWVRISLSREEATVEGPGGAWTTPISEFSAVALRKRPGFAFNLTNHTTNLNQRLYAGQSYPVFRRETLWWVELVHADPERSVPIWANFGEYAQPGAEAAARGFAHRFDLPVVPVETR